MPEVRDIPLTLIDPPENVLGFEERYENLDELAFDIRDNGLLYPLIVHAAGDRFVLRDGMRRWHACRQINLAAVRCIVHTEADPPPEAVKLKANLLRENNTDAEIAWWLGELAPKLGNDIARLVAETHRSESWINERLELLRGDPAVLQALAARQINFSQAKALNRCKNPALRADGLNYAVLDNTPATKLAKWIKENDSTQGTAGVPEGTTPQAPPPVLNSDGGVRCAWCGGDRDPQNMVNVWLHRWEWDVVQKILQGAQG